MNYNEVMEKIDELGKFGINSGLERTRILLENMGNPQNYLKFIHVAGTNGKGSVCSMLSEILIHAGYSTGVFSSPYIECFNEIMKINGKMIDDVELTECAEFVFHHWGNSAVNGEYPTQFEVITAIAFEWYKRKKCDFVCLEVGMGGLNDSTNIIPPPIMQIITSISLDHTNILGDNISKISKEKVGIIKGGVTVIYPLMHPDAIDVIEEKCKYIASKLVVPSLDNLEINTNDWRYLDFNYNCTKYHKKLIGEFQIYNAITVIKTAEELEKLGVNIKKEDIIYGIENAIIPSRMEIINEKPLVILDGAHNFQGISSLTETIEEMASKKINVIMGVLKDKDYIEMIKKVSSFANDFYPVRINNPRALDVEKIIEYSKDYAQNIIKTKNCLDAVRTAIDNTSENDILLICGSLYLASEIRTILLQSFREN